ncbi:MAG: hypothetical protein IIC74_07840 [Bacteroidetes bacterium]|nr:hypothetical protein [Bacteroidota bacterium]
MKYKNLLILLVIVCFACDKSDDEDVCTKTNSDFASVSGWLQLESSTLSNLNIVTFLNDDIGLVYGSFGTLLKTNSGGLCWEELDVLRNEYNYSLLSEFYILNENEIFASRIGFYKTTNGGKTFKEIETNDVWGGSITFDMHFFNENRGIICKSGINLYKTEDGGLTWVNIYSYQYGPAQRLQFVTNTVGYLYGGSGREGFTSGSLHKTIDGGDTWFKIESEPNITRASIRTMYFINENLGYFVNSLREFYVTENGGLTWTLRTTIEDTILDMVFVDESLGYVVGGRSVYKTEDGGVSWTEDYKSTIGEGDLVLISITKTPNGSIFVVGDDGIILKKE